MSTPTPRLSSPPLELADLKLELTLHRWGEELAAERARSAGLERSNGALEARLRELGGRLEAAGETDARKEAAFQQVKRQWSLVSQRLAAEQGHCSILSWAIHAL